MLGCILPPQMGWAVLLGLDCEYVGLSWASILVLLYVASEIISGVTGICLPALKQGVSVQEFAGQGARIVLSCWADKRVLGGGAGEGALRTMKQC